MKKRCAVCCVLCLLFCASALAEFGGGTGTPDDPFLIYTIEHLLSWPMCDGFGWDVHVKLMEDIDFEGELCPTLCSRYGFRGVFDGNHKTISNIYMENQPGFISPSAAVPSTLKNLTLINPVLVVTEGGLDAGILTGYYHSRMTIDNCHVIDATIEAPISLPVTEAVNVGGLACYNRNTILNSSFTGYASGCSVGGLAFYSFAGAVIENCSASVEIRGGINAGGLVCSNYGFIKNCHTTGTVRSEGRDWTDLGGLVGRNGGLYSVYYDGNGRGDGNGMIVDCYSNCNVSGQGKGGGGLVGICWGGAIYRCYATGWVSSYSYLGGLVGAIQTQTRYAYKGVIENCNSTGAVKGHDRIGGFAGECSSAIIRNCYSSGSAQGQEVVGGLIGCVYIYPYDGMGVAVVDKCYSVGRVTGYDRTGGMIGREWNGVQTVTNSFWDKQTSGWNTSAKGIGKTTVQMKTLSTFTDAGWDFTGETANGLDDIWMMQDVNYPILSWQFVNSAPVADAGPDQAVYAWIDGWADVQLDGSASYDADAHPLTFAWSWQIDGNSCDCNTINPTIRLPVGEHLITLVVNDGFTDSEPNTCTITVVPPIDASMIIAPPVLVRHARGPRNIIALARLSDNITRDQISPTEPLTLCPANIDSIRQSVIVGAGAQEGLYILAFFDKSELLNALTENGPCGLQIAGRLVTGQYFRAADSISIKADD